MGTLLFLINILLKTRTYVAFPEVILFGDDTSISSNDKRQTLEEVPNASFNPLLNSFSAKLIARKHIS